MICARRTAHAVAVVTPPPFNTRHPPNAQVEITDVVTVVAPQRTEEDRLVALSAADAARLRGGRAMYTAFQMVRARARASAPGLAVSAAARGARGPPPALHRHARA